MATAAASEARDTECSICHEPFTMPKLISCGHVLCRHCLLSWLTSQGEAPCPLCRRPIVSPETRQTQSLEEMVDSFPTDVTMKLLVESEQLLHKDHTCQSCVTQAASSLCLNCHDFLCASCSKQHGRLSFSRHHVVETLSSLTAEKLASYSFVPCQTHTNEIAQLYCSSHKVSVCLLCATSKHRNCSEVKDLEERAKETGAVFTELLTTLSENEAKLDQAIQELDDLFQETEKKAENAVAEIDQTFGRLKSEVEKHHQQAKESTLGKFSEIKKTIQDGKACLLQKRGTLISHRAVVQRGNRMAASQDMDEIGAQLKKRVKDTLSAMLPADAAVINTATFTINAGAVSGIEKALAELANVQMTPASVSAQVQVFDFHDNCGAKIVLSNNRQTAERKGTDSNGGIVLARQSMMTNMLYEVHLDERDAYNGHYLWVGAVTTDPGRITLPGNAGSLSLATVFYKDRVKVENEQVNTNIGQKLVDLPKGSRVGVMTDGSGRLHLYINGQDQGHTDTQVSQPCFALFDVFGSYRKITALPVRRVL